MVSSGGLWFGQAPAGDILALELASRVLPVEADRAGGHLQWLDDRESLVFANTFISGLLARRLENCLKIDGWRKIAAVLSQHTAMAA